MRRLLVVSALAVSGLAFGGLLAARNGVPVQAQVVADRYVVFESFMRKECGNCASAGPVLDQLDSQYAREGKKVLFLEHNNDDCGTNPASHQKQPCVGSNMRKQIYSVARPDARVLPLMMADSGAKTHWGAPQDWSRQIRSMVDPELRRLEGADIQAYYTRTGNTARVVALVTNKGQAALTAADRAQVWAVLVEDSHVVHTNHYVRAVKSVLISPDLPPNETGRYEIELSGTAGMNWSRARIAVMVDVRTASGTFDMLQAAIASQGEPTATATPTEEILPTDTPTPTEEVTPTETQPIEPTESPTDIPTEVPTLAPTTGPESYRVYLPLALVNWSFGE